MAQHNLSKFFFAPIILTMAALLTSTAEAYVCLDRDAETREMTVLILEDGCISSSNVPEPHTFKVELDAPTATIRIEGHFRHKSGFAQTMDCGGGQSLEVSLLDTDLRR